MKTGGKKPCNYGSKSRSDKEKINKSALKKSLPGQRQMIHREMYLQLKS